MLEELIDQPCGQTGPEALNSDNKTLESTTMSQEDRKKVKLQSKLLEGEEDMKRFKRGLCSGVDGKS